jgi:hypothetical protein
MLSIIGELKGSVAYRQNPTNRSCFGRVQFPWWGASENKIGHRLWLSFSAEWLQEMWLQQRTWA